MKRDVIYKINYVGVWFGWNRPGAVMCMMVHTHIDRLHTACKIWALNINQSSWGWKLGQTHLADVLCVLCIIIQQACETIAPKLRYWWTLARHVTHTYTYQCTISPFEKTLSWNQLGGHVCLPFVSLCAPTLLAGIRESWSRIHLPDHKVYTQGQTVCPVLSSSKILGSFEEFFLHVETHHRKFKTKLAITDDGLWSVTCINLRLFMSFST